MQSLFLVEVTDTFGGEPNYSYILRYRVRATTSRGAMRRIGKLTGLQWRKDCEGRYNTTCRTDCAFVEQWGDELHADYPQVDLTTLA